VKFITAPQGEDVSWTRDWGPHAVFTPDGTMKIVDGNYLHATPLTGLTCNDTLSFIYHDEQGNIKYTKEDDDLPGYIGAAIDIDRVSLPFSFTGGNVISDGQRSAFSTCVITNENRFIGVTDEAFLENTRKILGIEQYNIISNFEDNGIQHIDCYMKMLDEERLLVIRPPQDHMSYDQYEGIVTHELSKLTNAYGRPYQILRIDTKQYQGDDLAAYTNALILNHTVYVPLFGIPQDSVALQQWGAAMPGYTIKGFAFVIAKEPALSPQVKEIYKGAIGWNGHDALHCRTRAIWDPNMIYISVDRIAASVPKAKEYPVKVIIKDYSKGNLVPESLKVMYRVKGKVDWKESKLMPTGIPDQFKGEINGGQAGVTIEYYVAAHSNWGNTATMPRTAPKGFYQFKIE
jgi:agmatine/peptidylarginine deiminase